MVGKQILPGWDTIERIGSGGFSTVYKIKKSTASGDYYSALKVISIPKSQDEYLNYKADGYSDEDITQLFSDQVKSFVKEVKLMAPFSSSANIVNCEEYRVLPKEDGFGWNILIRMELLTTLTDYYSSVSFGEMDVIKLGADLCNALALCKQYNIVHRDIKPQNIFVNYRGDYKLGDFGIARVTEQATHVTRIGTYSYMSPEIYRGDAYNSTADIYSLGLVLYWLLNERRLPFLPLPPVKPTQEQLADGPSRRFAGEPLPPPKHGSDALKSIVLKAAAFNPSDRYQSAEDMCADLLELYNGANDEDHDQGDTETKEIVVSEGINWRLVSLVSLFSVLALSLVGAVILLVMGNSGGANDPSHNNSYIIYDDSKPWSDYGDNTDISAENKYPPFVETSTDDNGFNQMVNSSDKKVYHVSVDTQPTKTTYIIGESFDVTGLLLKVFYTDGTTEITNKGFTFESAPFEKVGKQKVLISYKNKQVFVEVTVDETSVKDFIIISQPDNTSYSVGDTFDPTGLVIKVIYADDTDVDLTTGFTCTPEEFTEAGRTKITVKYADIEKSFFVNVDSSYTLSAEKTNYALDKSYTLARYGTETAPGRLYLDYNKGVTKWADVYLKKITDGKVGNITDRGYNGSDAALENVTVKLSGLGAQFDYVFDLEECYGDIKSIVIRNARNGLSNGSDHGFDIQGVYVSDDGISWTKANGYLSSSPVPDAPVIKNDTNAGKVEHFNFTYYLNQTQGGRFVKLSISPNVGSVVQLEEIEIWN